MILNTCRTNVLPGVLKSFFESLLFTVNENRVSMEERRRIYDRLSNTNLATIIEETQANSFSDKIVEYCLHGCEPYDRELFERFFKRVKNECYVSLANGLDMPTLAVRTPLIHHVIIQGLRSMSLNSDNLDDVYDKIADFTVSYMQERTDSKYGASVDTYEGCYISFMTYCIKSFIFKRHAQEIYNIANIKSTTLTTKGGDSIDIHNFEGVEDSVVQLDNFSEIAADIHEYSVVAYKHTTSGSNESHMASDFFTEQKVAILEEKRRRIKPVFEKYGFNIDVHRYLGFYKNNVPRKLASKAKFMPEALKRLEKVGPYDILSFENWLSEAQDERNLGDNSSWIVKLPKNKQFDHENLKVFIKAVMAWWKLEEHCANVGMSILAIPSDVFREPDLIHRFNTLEDYLKWYNYEHWKETGIGEEKLAEGLPTNKQVISNLAIFEDERTKRYLLKDVREMVTSITKKPKQQYISLDRLQSFVEYGVEILKEVTGLIVNQQGVTEASYITTCDRLMDLFNVLAKQVDGVELFRGHKEQSLSLISIGMSENKTFSGLKYYIEPFKQRGDGSFEILCSQINIFANREPFYVRSFETGEMVPLFSSLRNPDSAMNLIDYKLVVYMLSDIVNDFSNMLQNFKNYNPIGPVEVLHVLNKTKYIKKMATYVFGNSSIGDVDKLFECPVPIQLNIASNLVSSEKLVRMYILERILKLFNKQLEYIHTVSVKCVNMVTDEFNLRSINTIPYTSVYGDKLKEKYFEIITTSGQPFVELSKNPCDTYGFYIDPETKDYVYSKSSNSITFFHERGVYIVVSRDKVEVLPNEGGI